jgi:hypothetical protein
MFSGIYRFQHAGEAEISSRCWRYSYRHAQGWAQTHGLAFPDEVSAPSSPSDLLICDDDLQPKPPHQIGQRR